MSADSPPITAPCSVWAAALAEGLGTAGLLAVVVGSGIMGERLAGGNVAIALLANSLATGAGLLALILAFAGISGAHFNPVVTVLAAQRGDLPWSRVGCYIAAQVSGALIGVLLAHGMFDMPLFQASTHVRTGTGQWLSEVAATCGLLLVIVLVSRHRAVWTPLAVAGYVTAGYWSAASTCMANPAVSLARAWTDTFSGIRPSDVPGFVLAQLGGLVSAVALLHVLAPSAKKS